MFGRRSLMVLFGAGVATTLLPRRLRAGGGDREAVVEMVETAARAVAEYGFPGALTHSDPDIWSRPAAGLYVFVMDRQGTLLLHPDGRMEGRNVAGAVDAEGAPFIRKILEACAAQPEGTWTDYLWRSAATGELGPKHTYSKVVGDLIVSAGYVAQDA